MIKIILIAIPVLIVVFLVAAAMQPKEFRIARSVTIAAPATAVFPQLNDLRQTQAWSPWLQLDPAAKITYDGPASGVGASNAWVGNSKIGEGRQTIVASTPNELVRVKLEFLKPMEDTATAEFLLKPAGAGTTVTWAMYGDKNYMAKVMCMFVSMDKMIGGDLDRGLANLKALAESGAKK